MLFFCNKIYLAKRRKKMLSPSKTVIVIQWTIYFLCWALDWFWPHFVRQHLNVHIHLLSDFSSSMRSSGIPSSGSGASGSSSSSFFLISWNTTQYCYIILTSLRAIHNCQHRVPTSMLTCNSMYFPGKRNQITRQFGFESVFLWIM